MGEKKDIEILEGLVGKKIYTRFGELEIIEITKNEKHIVLSEKDICETMIPIKECIEFLKGLDEK